MIESKLLIGYRILCACIEQLYLHVTMQLHQECKLVYRTQVFSIRKEINRVIDYDECHWNRANVGTRAVANLLLPHTPCIPLWEIHCA